jgi:chemotaxis protein MotB
MIDASEDPPRSNAPPPWIITFADLMVLLMCFFVLMLSFSEMDVAKFKQLSGPMNAAFGGENKLDIQDKPVETTVANSEIDPSGGEPAKIAEVRKDTAETEATALAAALAARAQELQAREDDAERQAVRLQDIFKQEVEDGRLQVRREGTEVVVQLLEKDSFASGSADLEKGAFATLDKIGTLLRDMQGTVRVSGHTDNVPIRNGQYRSNWDLSAARAASVAHRLLDVGLEPRRLVVSGHADTQPRAANDTAANRALNRRVDITFVDAPAPPSGDAAESLLR